MIFYPQSGGPHPKLPMTTPVPKEELEDEELFIEPFVAWRAWAVYADDVSGKFQLRSITYKSVWPVGEPIVATCGTTWDSGGYKSDPHPCPDPGHSCGIYAVKKEDVAKQWMNSGYYVSKPELRCVGEVKLWGKVYRYTEGYLAEFAYPLRLFLDPMAPESFPVDSREAAHELRRTYKGVEVRLM